MEEFEPNWITFEELETLKRGSEREPVKPMINGVMPKHSPLPAPKVKPELDLEAEYLPEEKAPETWVNRLLMLVFQCVAGVLFVAVIYGVPIWLVVLIYRWWQDR